MKKKIHVIAEAGTNHNGDLNKAINLANLAKISGADSVKYQIIYPEGLYLPGDYEYGHYDIKDVIRIRTKGILTDQEYSELASYCKEIGISFTASVFDTRGLDLITAFDPLYIKIASCDLNNIRLLRQVAERGYKMVISTGMSTLADIEISVNELVKVNFNDFVLLHCVSVYPATLDQTNLNFISTLKHHFDCEVGFSDHTRTSIAACMALAKGATWFEKHLTEDTTQEGFDHAYAMEGEELATYVNDIRMANNTLNSNKDKLSDKEIYTRKRARRSLYAAKNMRIGDTIEEEDILVVRPEDIMDANQIDNLIGKKIKIPLKQYQPFSLENIS